MDSSSSSSRTAEWRLSDEEREAIVASAVSRTFARLEHRRRTAESRRTAHARDAADDEAAAKDAKAAEEAFEREWEDGVEARVKSWRRHQDGVGGIGSTGDGVAESVGSKRKRYSGEGGG